MKLLYAFLFGMDTVLLALFTYLFLKISDSAHHEWPLLLLLMAIIGCMVSFVLLLTRYLKMPAENLPDQ